MFPFQDVYVFVVFKHPELNIFSEKYIVCRVGDLHL